MLKQPVYNAEIWTILLKEVHIKREVTSSHEIGTQIDQGIDLGSHLVSWVHKGHEIESEVGMCKDGNLASLWSHDPT